MTGVVNLRRGSKDKGRGVKPAKLLESATQRQRICDKGGLNWKGLQTRLKLLESETHRASMCDREGVKSSA